MLSLRLSLRRRSIQVPCLHSARRRRTLHEVFDATRTGITTREDELSVSSSCSGVWAATPAAEAENASAAAATTGVLKRRTRRRLKDHDFVDQIVMTVSAGRGGDGCVAFHKPATARAPRNPYRLGPPSGGDGGRGGSVYLLPDDSLTSLVSVPRKVAGKPGTNGSGEWRNGKRGKDRIVRVPVGTVVRVLGWGGAGAGGEWPIEGQNAVGKKEVVGWVHYPGCAEANVGREEFVEAERWLEREERRRMREGKRKWGTLVEEGREIELDAELREEEDVVDTVNEALGKKRKESLGYLIATGGAGGLGNPHFGANLSTGTTPSSSSTTGFARSPKFATRGVGGEVLMLSLEVKTNADVALVGRCSVGKSTLIRALTGGRVKSDVGGWEGVTRGVVRGVVRVAQREGEGRVWEGELGGVRVFDESMDEGGGERATEDVGGVDEFSPVPTKAGHGFDLYESFRFMITDNPGFVFPTDEGQELAPITQTILRSIERAKVLVYVVDLSGDAPWDELGDVIKEVARGSGGRGERRAMVVANKADLLVGAEGAEEEVAGARAKLTRLEEYVAREMGDGTVEVVPVSAKWGMNLGKVVRSLEVLLTTFPEESELPIVNEE